jgi:ATP-dependent helicase HrpA
LLGYPALVDDGDAVKITVHDEPGQARRQHQRGLACLFRLALREPLRFFARNLPDQQRLTMLYMPFGGTEELRQDLVFAVLMRTALLEPWPEDAEAFEARVRDTRPRITLVGNEIARTLSQILEEQSALQRKLAGVRGQAQAHADLSAQLATLLPRDFLAITPIDRLAHLPRYLKAASARIDKLRADPARDARLMSDLSPMLQNLQRARVALRGEPDARLDEFRWMIEELRVSLFAQELRTPMPISVKRLQKIWESMR